jgi:hypothetical protein
MAGLYGLFNLRDLSTVMILLKKQIKLTLGSFAETNI